MISTLLVQHAASLIYPVMLAQTMNEISESKAAELLAMSIEDYRHLRGRLAESAMKAVLSLPSPLLSLLDIMKDRPDLLTRKD